MFPDSPIRRRADGTIDTEFYAHRARTLRSHWIRDAIRPWSVTLRKAHARLQDTRTRWSQATSSGSGRSL